MAIKVIKHGEKTFKITCPVCGCEFEYEYEDLTPDYLPGLKRVKCPDCGEWLAHNEYKAEKNIIWTAPDVDKTGGKETKDKMFYVDYQNPPVLWNHSQWPDCETCPNKPAKDGKLIVGDTPCTWCPKMQPYCTCDGNTKFTVTTTTIGLDNKEK